MPRSCPNPSSVGYKSKTEIRIDEGEALGLASAGSDDSPNPKEIYLKLNSMDEALGTNRSLQVTPEGHQAKVDPDETAASVPGSMTDYPASAASQTNLRPLRYTGRYAAFIIFEQDNIGGCINEAQSLKSELEDRWGFIGKIYKIPFIDPPAELQKQVDSTVSSFIKTHDRRDNLLLVHYGGHGLVNNYGMYTLSMGNAGKSYDVYFRPIREQLLKCKSDVAIFLDACESGAARYRYYQRHTVEILAACAEDKSTPSVGPKSFTSGILRVLRNRDQDLSLKELFEELKKLEQPHLTEPPVHYTLRQSEFGSITFQRSARDPETTLCRPKADPTENGLSRFLIRSLSSIWPRSRLVDHYGTM